MTNKLILVYKMESSEWVENPTGTFSYIPYIPEVNEVKIAGFDLDYTIVRSYLSQFPKISGDYKFLPNRQDTLNKYVDDGFIIVIFTNNNQKTIKGQYMIINRIVNIVNNIKYLTWVYLSTRRDNYRKPETGMWDLMLEILSEYPTPRTPSGNS